MKLAPEVEVKPETVVTSEVNTATETTVAEQAVEQVVVPTHAEPDYTFEPDYSGEPDMREYEGEYGATASLDDMFEQMDRQVARAIPISAPIDTTTTVVTPVNTATPTNVPPPPADPVAPATVVTPPLNTGGAPADNAYQPPQFQNTGAGVVTQYNAPAAETATLTPLNMTKEQQRGIMEQVFARLFNHLFSKCDFNPQAYQSSFGHPEGVLEYAVAINDIPGANQLFVAHDFGDQVTGLTSGAPNDTGIRGTILKNTRLPSYSMWVNKAGVKTQLKMIPQNPDKTYPDGDTRAGQLKPSAVRVRHNGSAITWVMEETPRGQMSNYLLAYEMDVGKPLSWRWMGDK